MNNYKKQLKYDLINCYKTINQHPLVTNEGEKGPQIASPEKLNKLKVFISHGTSDNVLNIEYAREANAYLKTIKLIPTYNEFEGGHTVSNEMLLSLIDWLKSE